MTPQEIITKAESFEYGWYHRIELTPGYFTKSRMDGSFHIWDMVRRVRRGIEYKGKTVLDIGTMDGMWAFEAEALGAASVDAADVFQEPLGENRLGFAISAKRSIVKAHRWDAQRLTDFCGLGQFDIIQCLGMLYHVENPLAALREMRACLNPHGLMLLETSCWCQSESIPVVRLNTDNGVYHDATTFWVPNKVALFDMLKLAGFKPLDGSIHVTPEPKSYRTCMICQPI